MNTIDLNLGTRLLVSCYTLGFHLALLRRFNFSALEIKVRKWKHLKISGNTGNLGCNFIHSSVAELLTCSFIRIFVW